jgi:hypothetical protein
MPFKSLVDYLFEPPITAKQRSLNELDKIKSLFLKSADGIRTVTKNSHHYKSLFNDCLKDITKAENLLNNWDDVAGANDLIAKINFNRGLLWERYAELFFNKTGRASKGGQTTAKCKAEKLKGRNDKIKAHADKLLSEPECKEPWEVASLLAKRYGLTDRQIRNILKNTET